MGTDDLRLNPNTEPCCVDAIEVLGLLSFGVSVCIMFLQQTGVGGLFLAKWKMAINYVQMINSVKPSITRRRHVPISSAVPLEISLLNVCAYFPWPLIFELQLAPMQNMKHFKLHNAD